MHFELIMFDELVNYSAVRHDSGRTCEVINEMVAAMTLQMNRRKPRPVAQPRERARGRRVQPPPTTTAFELDSPVASSSFVGCPSGTAHRQSAATPDTL
jgi:hypothetical protein